MPLAQLIAPRPRAMIRVAARIGVSPSGADFATLRRALRRTESGDILAACGEAAGGTRLDDIRSAARVAAALLPHSLPAIRRWLRRTRWPLSEELHFQLFLSLALVCCLSARPPRAILQLAGDYLLAAGKDRSQAAWMAADLLGAHWGAQAAYEVLSMVLRKARHPAAREAAANGLHSLVAFRKPGRALAARVRAALRKAERVEPNASTRAWLGFTLLEVG